uniref:Uncharacterized protein n=1 Tax=Arundo donax TaxID=35708 RepID=A0A0A9CQW3_ARUDO
MGPLPTRVKNCRMETRRRGWLHRIQLRESMLTMSSLLPKRLLCWERRVVLAVMVTRGSIRLLQWVAI